MDIKMIYKNDGKQRVDQCEENWPQNYYEEFDETFRKEMLDKIEQSSQIADPELELRKQIWELRYGVREHQKTQIDYFIRGLVNLKSIFSEMDSLFGKKRCQKLLEEVKKDLCMTDFDDKAEAYQQMLQKEWDNLAKYYFKICIEDRNFSTGAMGLFKLKDEEIIDKIADEIILLMVRVPMAMNHKEDFKLIRDIFLKAFADTFYDGNKIIDEKMARIK